MWIASQILCFVLIVILGSGLGFEEQENEIQLLSENFLSTQFPFDLSQSEEISCRNDSGNFMRSLKNFELWALEMHDSTTKFSSGVLTGNVNQYGNFDQCLTVVGPEKLFQGKYCLAYLQPKVLSRNQYLRFLENTILSYRPFKSDLDDPGFIIPKISAMQWGICVPSSCSGRDVEVFLKNKIQGFVRNTGLSIDVLVDDYECQIKEENWFKELSGWTKITILLGILIVVLVTSSTLYEVKAKNINNNSPPNPWLTAFSLINNTKQLFSTKRDANDIEVAHGIRFLAVLLLLIAHKAMVSFFHPVLNRNEFVKMSTNPFSVILRSAVLFTDTFLLLSGMLTGYSIFGRYLRGENVNYLKEIAGRYLRIFPSIGVLMLFNTHILPLLGSGPAWMSLVQINADMCKKNWWPNLFFMQNYLGVENICLTNTHYVAVDTQLFAISPLITWLIWKWPKRGSLFVGLLILFSSFLRYYASYTHHLSIFIAFGSSIKQLIDTANYMYILPSHRLSSYCMGILLSYILRVHKGFSLSEKQTKLIWRLWPLVLLASILGPVAMTSKETAYNPISSGLFASLAPIGWCLCVAWFIYSVQHGFQNKAIDCLKWKGFLIVTRISYPIYLIQFMVFFYNIAQIRTSQYFGMLTLASTNEYLCIIGLSILLSLFIEHPFLNIKKLLFTNKPKNIKTD